MNMPHFPIQNIHIFPLIRYTGSVFSICHPPILLYLCEELIRYTASFGKYISLCSRNHTCQEVIQILLEYMIGKDGLLMGAQGDWDCLMGKQRINGPIDGRKKKIG